MTNHRQSYVGTSDVPSDLDTNRVLGLIKAYRKILGSPVRVDEYLAGVARRYPTHRFLGNSIQAIYSRQVVFLSELLTKYLRVAPSDISVLDWGCGKGHITYLLKKFGFSVISCDRMDNSDDSAFGQQVPIISEQSISVTPLVEDVALPFQSGIFDCVTSFGVLEHVPDDLQSLREIRRVVRTGGVVYLTCLPYALSWTQALARIRGDNYHDRLYWRNTVQCLARSSGFSVQGMWFGQLFPKNSVSLSVDPIFEPVDRMLCRYTPLKFFATNLEVVLTAD